MMYFSAYLSAFYRYYIPSPTPTTMPALYDKYDTALSLSSVPSGYMYDQVHGCVLTNPTGCSCTLVQLHVYYVYNTVLEVKNYITTVTTDPLLFGYTEDTSQSLWCVPATSPSGTCGATMMLDRYYNGITVDHALGVVGDTTLTSNGYSDEGAQCYVWPQSMCTTTTPSPATTSTTATSVMCGGLSLGTTLLSLIRYTNNLSGTLCMLLY
jgi:hypothetical protein